MVTDELTLLLKAKGILICPEQKSTCATAVQEVAHSIGRMGIFSTIFGGQHASDVAVACILSKRIMAERGVDWDWEFNYNNNHYNMGFSRTRGGKRLFVMFWDYNKAHARANFGAKLAEMGVLENVW